ncbi:MAG: GTPase Era [Gammaproteobacteria bacterium SG8_47]|nr:MAG: GTPase Era [Gammaproteobacteria bacterium SG8_47]
MTTTSYRSGYVAIVGRPNVGKSTLLNHILGQKISITSRKPQTTRHRIRGIKTTATAQAVYVDTPGIHHHQSRAMNRLMNRAAAAALADVHVVVMVVEAMAWQDDDDLALSEVSKSGQPVILVVNKVDKVADKSKLLPFLESCASRGSFAEVIPVSAFRAEDVARVEAAVARLLPEGPAEFPEDQVTDRSLRFIAAELVREKLMRRLGQEVPYQLTVEIEEFSEGPELTRIGAVIWVEKRNQKGIVIGAGGERLKQVGQEARQELEQLMDTKVFLRLWVKVKEGWSDDLKALHSLGYDDESS